MAKISRLAPRQGIPRDPLDRSMSSSNLWKRTMGGDIVFSDTGSDNYTTSNPGTRLRHAKVPCGGFLLTSPDLNRQSASSYDSELRPNVSGTEVKPRNPEGQMPISGGSPPDDDNPGGPERDPEMLLQPETRPISHEQLVVEVKGIYAGLVMVEAECIDIDERQFAAAQEKDPAKKIQLKNDQWHSLIALHKQLLHKHHDFFLASQHPSASPALSRLAAKYSMPARMWRHGIHAFLEVLRHRLPESLEHMLAFIYIAYTMMALLYETVPTFEDTWIECLGNLTVIRCTFESNINCIYVGDLGRYRMAIEDEEPRDREVWSNVARFWYYKTLDKAPTVGRFYHHLAILARPYSIEQLSLYTRALTCLTPFEGARGSVLTLFNPILQGQDPASRRSSSFETVFIRAHGILFTSQPSDSLDRFDEAVEELDTGGLYGNYISKSSSRFKETGVHAAVSNIAALLEYGTPKPRSSNSSLRFAYEDAHRVKKQLSQPVHSDLDVPGNKPPSAGPSQPQADTSMTSESERSPVFIIRASRLAFITLGISLTCANDRNMYPLVHAYLVFIWSLILVQQAWKKFEDNLVWRIIETDVPWAALCSFLNTLAAEPQVMTAKVWAEDFPKPDKEAGRLLPKDFVIRGQLYSRWYFPYTWSRIRGLTPMNAHVSCCQ